MVSGFLACAVTLGSGLLLVGGSGYLQPPGATATPVLAAAVASLAALASVLVHSRLRLRRPILPLLMLVTLGIGACAPTLPDTSTVEVEIDPSALTTFHEGEELWGVRDIIESGDVIWVLTGAAPFLRAYDRSGRMLADFGNSGQGPGELRNPWILSAATSAGEVVAWDLATRRRSVFDATGNFVISTPTAIARESVRADIRSVTFGDPFRVVEDSSGVWTASYPDGISRGDDFWEGKIVRYAHGDAEPVVVVDFSVDLPGAASRVPAMGLGPVPLWDGCGRWGRRRARPGRRKPSSLPPQRHEGQADRAAVDRSSAVVRGAPGLCPRDDASRDARSERRRRRDRTRRGGHARTCGRPPGRGSPARDRSALCPGTDLDSGVRWFVPSSRIWQDLDDGCL